MGVQSFEFRPGSGHSICIHRQTPCHGGTETTSVGPRGQPRAAAAAGNPPAPGGCEYQAGLHLTSTSKCVIIQIGQGIVKP